MRTHTSQSSGNSTSTTATRHIPVLLQQVRDVLDIQDTDTVLDATLGGGGHALALANTLGGKGTFVGIDADAKAIERARKKLKGVAANCIFIHTNFRNLESKLKVHGITEVDAMLFDLGISSDQLEQSGRGFSFDRDEPLSMTLADEHAPETLTAEEIVNTWDEEHLSDIFHGWGGERYARRIARAITEKRSVAPLATTKELSEVVIHALPPRARHAKRHPATRVFQALRIAVNDELGALTDALAALLSIKVAGSRVAIISFHSLEDRIVKQTFRQWEEEGLGARIHKKAIIPTRDEVSNNPRARSAKLRSFRFTHYEHTFVQESEKYRSRHT